MEEFVGDFMHDVIGETIFPELAETSERARWRLSDIHWDEIDPARANPATRALVRQIAFSEQTTFSATQKFLQAFSDDLDFSQWLSVWFYEETRHPLVLMRWLASLDEHCDSTFVARGRVSAPFMRSRMGTLTTNIISEVNAAALYAGLGRAATEPVLAAISRSLSSDEARHASSFYRYAARRIERSAHPDRDRVDAVKVLHFWLHENHQVGHPVNQHVKPEYLPSDTRDRVCRLIGTLVDLPLWRPDHVHAWLTRLVGQEHGARDEPIHPSLDLGRPARGDDVGRAVGHDPEPERDR
jgi:hypothetical protein